ncbi:MAG TPA: hypothetical protein VFF12_19625 [Myxococcaceae bacterium]|nr:hypothetical protein [Myxococcaceae bacterium]
MPRVDISDGGRAGSITYREGLHTVTFSWEFALSPALAVINGPTAREWDQLGGWAAGRQEEIFEHVADEVIRQKASGHTADLDLEAGTITVLESAPPPGRKPRGSSPGGPLDAVGELAESELEELIDLILREGMSGPTVDALAQIDHPKAYAAVDEASRHHLSVDIRLAAAEALHARGALADLEPVLVRELKAVNRRTDGLARALRLAKEHPTPAVRQALLWASWNQTECAADCARLLLGLVAGPGAVETMAEALRGLELHTSFFQRKAAFEALCQKLGMTLDPG